MGYCTVDNVRNEFNSLEVAGAPPVTSSDIELFIDQESAVIDSFLCERYTVPVGGAESLLALQKICTHLVAFRVATILKMAPLNVSPDGSVAQKNSYVIAQENAMKLLLGYKVWKISLPDATPVNSGGIMAIVSETPQNQNDEWI